MRLHFELQDTSFRGSDLCLVVARNSWFVATLMTIRRLKTYAGSQGYVYQYYFVGKPPAAVPDSDQSDVLRSDANEYVFDVTSDRKLTYAVSIFLSHKVVASWAESHEHTLSDSEQYAAVKMRWFRAFDELDEMPSHGRQLEIDSESLEQSLRSLGVGMIPTGEPAVVARRNRSCDANCTMRIEVAESATRH